MLLPLLQTFLGFQVNRPDILEGPVDVLGLTAFVTWILGEVTANSSWVDRVWTFVPPLYTAYFTFLPWLSGAPPDLIRQGINPRAALMLAVQVVWSLRLSYNTNRRGLFALSDEDYRWAILRSHLPGILYKIFNLVFISTMQHILLFSMSLPAYAALLQPQALTSSDYLLAFLSLSTVLVQFVADNQQWSYHQFKQSGEPDKDAWPGANLALKEADRKRGFVANGLWRFSRHPNFLCEQLFWTWNALFPILAGNALKKQIVPKHCHNVATLLNASSFKSCLSVANLTPLWPIASALGVSFLFQASTLFTEYVTSGKYPEYKVYQSRVGMFSPASTLVKIWLLKVKGQKSQADNTIWGKQDSGDKQD